MIYGDDEKTSLRVPDTIRPESVFYIENPTPLYCILKLDYSECPAFTVIPPYSRALPVYIKHNHRAYNCFPVFLFYDRDKHKVLKHSSGIFLARPQMQGEMGNTIILETPSEFIESLGEQELMKIDLE